MFTGIIEALGTIDVVRQEGGNRTFVVRSPISAELKIDQSISHNGVCLTVTSLSDGTHTVTAIAETLEKTSLGHLLPGHTVNLERCMLPTGRLDGHIVQGHTDAVTQCIYTEALDGSWLYDFAIPAGAAHLLTEKGSVCLNGVSLTVFNVSLVSFRVAIIPYTHAHTTFGSLQAGDSVNIEYDIIGKYVARMMEVRQA
ncbi:MAG: riboflavin synthase [Bacteroidota bacterium]